MVCKDCNVMNLVYWRDVKKSGIVFGALMIVLMSLAYVSFISVMAYSSLALLATTLSFRIYTKVMQTVNKSQQENPLKEYLELETDIPAEKAHEFTDVAVSQINCTVSQLKSLFLVEDLFASFKFGCLLWVLTYIGSWFNGLTLVILAVVFVFTLPKVYEQNQAVIDQYIGLVTTQVNDIMNKVKEAVPLGKKEKAQ